MACTHGCRALRLALFASAAFGVSVSVGALPAPLEEFTTVRELGGSPLKRLPARKAWREVAPGLREVRIRSSADGSHQPALFYAPDTDAPRPLLVALHSWSSGYLDHASIPYGVWAERNGWVLVHPHYRGRFDDPDATGSELAVSDIVDAVEYAQRHANVDPRRVYLVGYSGGAMMALTMAGRHPELWTAVVAWVPVFDIGRWYAETSASDEHRRYAREIRRSCGGAPEPGTEAAAECLRRSAKAHLEGARQSGVRVFIAAGVRDQLVSPTHAIEAFNALADEDDQVAVEEYERLLDPASATTRPAGHLHGPEITVAPEDSMFASVGRPLLLKRTSGQATLLLFEGQHDVVYNAGLLWLAGLDGEPGLE